MPAPSQPTNIHITRLSVDSFQLTWSTKTSENIVSNSFSYNDVIFANLPVSSPTIIDKETTNYKVLVSGFNKMNGINLTIGNNDIRILSVNVVGTSASSILEIFTYNIILIHRTYSDYNIIYSGTLSDLTQQTVAMMSIGWQPLGGVIIRTLPYNLSYMQTMVFVINLNVIHI